MLLKKVEIQVIDFLLLILFIGFFLSILLQNLNVLIVFLGLDMVTIAIFYFFFNLKTGAVYNPFLQKVEFHLGRTGSIYGIRATIKKAEKMNKNIIFYTNHFPKERLTSVSKYQVLIEKASPLRYLLFYPSFFLVTLGKKKKIYPLLKCEIICNESQDRLAN